jgi:hypothetical protein
MDCFRILPINAIKCITNMTKQRQGIKQERAREFKTDKARARMRKREQERQ